VFNLELPSSASHYAHRAGRTGRMGAPGLVITLVAPGERFVVERLSKKLGVPIMVRDLEPLAPQEYGLGHCWSAVSA
jgi:superfamily II DNA/RNA helicase